MTHVCLVTPNTDRCWKCGSVVSRLRDTVPSPEPRDGLRSPTPDEAETLVLRAERIAANTGLSFKECLDGLRDATGWVKPVR